MITKSDIKLIRSLAHKKYRTKHGLFIAEGEKIIGDMLKNKGLSSRFRIRSLFATHDWVLPVNIRKSDSLKIIRLDEKELNRCSSLVSPNKVIVLAEIPEPTIDYEEIGRGLTLVLEAIRDPGNLGSIIRTAHWFGVKNIICSTDSVDVYNPKTIQTTMGSFLFVKVNYMVLTEFFEHIKKMEETTVFGCYLHGNNVYTIKPSKAGIVVLGNESTGISFRLSSCIDERIYIPAFSQINKPDSLNVAHAAVQNMYLRADPCLTNIKPKLITGRSTRKK